MDLIIFLTLVALLFIVVIYDVFYQARYHPVLYKKRHGPEAPPNMVLVGISLFLTLYIMNPVIGKINEEAISLMCVARLPYRKQ